MLSEAAGLSVRLNKGWDHRGASAAPIGSSLPTRKLNTFVKGIKASAFAKEPLHGKRDQSLRQTSNPNKNKS